MTDYHPQGLRGTGDTAALRGVQADAPKSTHVAAQKLEKLPGCYYTYSTVPFFIARDHTRTSVKMPIKQNLNPRSD